MKKMIFKSGFWAGFFTLTGVVILVALGSWQVQRLQWKADVLTRIEARMNQPPAAMPEDIRDVDQWDYRRVSVTGRFLHDHTFYLAPRQFDDQVGGHLLTPFQRSSGDVILINRGFVPDPDHNEITYPAGEVKISGVVHIPDDRNMFTPENTVGSKHVFWTDTGFISTETRLDVTGPLVLYEDIKDKGLYPVGGQIRLNIPNDHLQYAVFWYMMALVLSVIYYLYAFGFKQESNHD
jgi:surfeit locus 1 family protein